VTPLEVDIRDTQSRQL